MMRMPRSPAMMSSLWLSLQCALATEALRLLGAKRKFLNEILLDIVMNKTLHLAIGATEKGQILRDFIHAAKDLDGCSLDQYVEDRCC